MAHFAELGDMNIVKRIVTINNEVMLDSDNTEQESLGIQFCENLFGGTWVQTSYNNSFRKNYAGIGYTYDVVRDAFIPPRPYPSWILNEETCAWESPVPIPDLAEIACDSIWNEETKSWDIASDSDE